MPYLNCTTPCISYLPCLLPTPQQFSSFTKWVLIYFILSLSPCPLRCKLHRAGICVLFTVILSGPITGPNTSRWWTFNINGPWRQRFRLLYLFTFLTFSFIFLANPAFLNMFHLNSKEVSWSWKAKSLKNNYNWPLKSKVSWVICPFLLKHSQSFCFLF